MKGMGVYVPAHLCMCIEVFQGICCVLFLWFVFNKLERRAKGKLNAKRGLILLPDRWPRITTYLGKTACTARLLIANLCYLTTSRQTCEKNEIF